jgi:hypothetical protein
MRHFALRYDALMDFIFKRGGVWEQAPEDSPLGKDDTRGLDEILTEKGYRHLHSYGPSEEPTIVVWSSNVGPYVVLSTIGDEVLIVYAWASPDLLELLALLMPLASGDLLRLFEDTMETLDVIAKKNPASIEHERKRFERLKKP